MIENMFDFSIVTFLVPLKYVHKFEKANPNVSVKIYNLKKWKSTYKNNIVNINISTKSIKSE